MDFVSFHTHTTYSYGDGYGPVSEHVDRVADLGMSALGISEHGNVNSHAALERECRRRGIKPIFGVEAYFGPVGDRATRRKYHITLFARDEEGYRNLNRIVTQSYIDSYQFPTVSPAVLKKYSNGIVAFSGCADSLVSCTLLGGKLLGDKRLEYTADDYRKTSKRISWLQDIFKDRFYLEVQRFAKLERSCVLNPAFAEIGRELGVPLIATADVHYPFPWQNTLQTTLHAARRGSTVEITDANWEYDILLTYPESDQEIENDLVGTGLSQREASAAIQQTALLAQSCSVELPKARPLRFPGVAGAGINCSGKHNAKPDAGDLDEVAKLRATLTLKDWIKKGWKRRVYQRPNLVERKPEYSKRINHEFKIIADKDFCDYFLVVADLVQYAKSQNITVGPGRGSGAGSLICYLLGITEIDPLHPIFNRMLFERFIDPTRSDMPDIDLDFDDELRYKIPARAVEIYGTANVCKVANHVGYQGKNSLKDVARAYGLYEEIFKPIAKRIPDRTETDERLGDTILDTIESYADSDEVAQLLSEHGDKIRQACQFEGGEHSMGVHAGGFIIASDPIPDVCAIYEKESGSGPKKHTIQVIPYEKRDAEYLGMLKMDFLGLTTMGMIGKCREWTGMDLDTLYTLFYDAVDNEENGIYDNIMSLFQSDDVTGLFQYEGGTTREVTRKVKPSNFDELAACNALSRPGPYYGNQTKDYIAVKNGEKDWVRRHENFDRHVEWTYGQIVYQEQIMFILRDLAGFDIPTVLRVRKIIGKKLGEHQFAALWEQFRDGVAQTSGIDESDALTIWGSITTAAGYAFNIPHAYSYALIAWWQGYFKLYNKAPFFAASLAKNGDGKKQLPRRIALLQDASRHEITIGDFDPAIMGVNWQPYRVPNQAKSKRETYVEGIIPGFLQLPQIGEGTAEDIVEWRRTDWQTGDLTWANLIAVPGVGEGTILKMAEFSFDPDPFGIKRTEDQLEKFRLQCRRGEFDKYGLPASGTFITSNQFPDADCSVAFVGLVANVVERDEIESIRQRSGRPVPEIRAELDEKLPGQYKKATIFAYDEYGEIALRISRWKYGSVSSKLSAIKPDYHIIVAWGKAYSEKSGSIQCKELWILDPD